MTRLATSALALGLTASGAFAACDSVTFSDVGWTDITATTAATTLVLDALGYETDIKVLSVPVTYTSMANGDIDVELPVGVDVDVLVARGSAEISLASPQNIWACAAAGSVDITVPADAVPFSSCRTRIWSRSASQP